MDPDSESSERALARLLVRAGGGDFEAFDRFIVLSAGVLLALARGLVEEVDVEALTASVFVAAWSNIATFDSDQATPHEWLAMIARHLAGVARPQ